MNYDEDGNDFEKDLTDADLLDGLGESEGEEGGIDGGEESEENEA
jgi:hypothetical protein